MGAPTYRLKRIEDEPENPFFRLIEDQEVAIVPKFTLESGIELENVPVAYKTWGKLNAEGNNAMVICHALTGSADVSDWWGPLLGPGKAFDPTRFFIVCLNSLGSPYGSMSPCTNCSETGRLWGPEFPLVSVRDDVQIHKLVLDDLGVRQIAACIGGSMGGMLVLEYAFFGPEYVRTIIPIATSARHSAWCISWGEAQRQSIYSDPKYMDGYYSFDDPPVNGLSAARMSALLTYRSRNSFETRFGREVPDPARHKTINGPQQTIAPPAYTNNDENWRIHNDGLKNDMARKISLSTSSSSCSLSEAPGSGRPVDLERARSGSSSSVASVQSGKIKKKHQTFFSAQSYLRYQGEKFVKRFDANCYIAITRKLDTHDIARGRFDTLAEALATLKQPALIMGIRTDGLFTIAEQEEIATHMPNAEMQEIDSPEGHDAFLLEFALVNERIVAFLERELPELMSVEVSDEVLSQDFAPAKESLFGEAEVDGVTNW